MSALPSLHTPEDVAESLHVSAWWVREQARKGRVHAVKVAGAWRFTDAQYQELLDLHTTTPAPAGTDVNSRRERRTDQPAPELRLVARLPKRAAGS
ncbi:helix-turn-helix domain-containing protein [Streptomyces rubiginosohelvolus]|uniref:helix-turn-helix domain-containing protein n=1 Tax=Streptomyces rubiginosohelvolus TaxID=67362 RepID=UPI0036517739